MPRVTWTNIADAAIADLNGRIEGVGRAASWDNPALTTWDDLNNTVEMELLRRKSQWSNLGMTDEEHLKEMIAEARAAAQGRQT